jgi:hypothetical protein
VVTTVSPSAPARRPALRALAGSWRWLAALVGLCLATYLYAGYRYDVWPQPGFLANVLAFSGRLKGDWYTTELPAGHWALDHALALLPHGLLEPAVLVLWVVGLAALWGGFLLIADALGLPPATAALAGLVLIPTALGGFGVSESLVDYFYPGTFAFACSTLALGLALRDRPVLAGAAAGAAVLCHPGVGPFAVLVTLPVVWWAADRPRRALVRYAVPLVILGLPSIVQLVSDQLSGGTLTPSELYDFLVIVRIPHHLRYASFTGLEYARTGAWALGLVLSLAVLWRLRAARGVALVSGVIAVVCLAGALASFVEWPLLLVEAQTARLSPFIVLLGVVALAAALHRVTPVWAPIALALTFLLTPRVLADVLGRFPQLGDVVRESLIEAAALIAALVVALVVVQFKRDWTVALGRYAVPVALAALVGCTISLLVERADRVPGVDPVQAQFDEIAVAAQHNTVPGDVVLTPPQMDGFRVVAERGDVLEFGSIRLGHGDREWRQRLLDVTGDPRILTPEPWGTDVARRTQAMADDYSHTVATSRRPVCRYDVRMVVADAQVPVPPWLQLVSRNDAWQLLAVRRDACDGYRYRPVPDPNL